MDIFSDLMMGLSIAITPINMMYLVIGAMVGMIVGVIPGFGPSAGLAILLPLTFGMDPVGAIVMLAAIYYGSMYGGTITSILLNTPGESATVASTFDGYPLAKNGRAGPALVMQAVASFVGGTVGVILITILAPMFAQVSRSFGPPEYFLLAMMGMLTLIVMIGSNWKLGIISALIGFALGTVGVDLETGQSRYTFGSAELIGGIYFIPRPATVMGQLQDMATGRRRVHLGHTPLGALMIFNLLITLLAIGATGYMMTTNAFWGVAWVEEAHEVLVSWAEISVMAHIAAVIVESWRTGVNLPRAMVSGIKTLPDDAKPSA